MKADLSTRYTRKVLKRDFYIPLLIVPLVATLPAYLFKSPLFELLVVCFNVVAEITYLGILYFFSITFLKTWLKKHPRYKSNIKDISNSYITGDAYECSYFCVVIGPKYIHGFDGEKFNTVLRDNVESCTWVIERLIIYASGRYGEEYLGDEYRFNIRFNCKNADSGSSFRITLDQFQIKMIMERYFPDISSDENPKFIVKKVYKHKVSCIKKYASEPVI